MRASVKVEKEDPHGYDVRYRRIFPVGTIAKRGAIFFTYLVAFMASMATIGLIPTAFFFVIIFMRMEGPEPWPLVLTYAVAVVASSSSPSTSSWRCRGRRPCSEPGSRFFKIIPSV